MLGYTNNLLSEIFYTTTIFYIYFLTYNLLYSNIICRNIRSSSIGKSGQNPDPKFEFIEPGGVRNVVLFVTWRGLLDIDMESDFHRDPHLPDSSSTDFYSAGLI